MKKVKVAAKFITSIVISLAAGGIGSLATIPNIASWYSPLDKPPFLPPNEVFGPVWSLLYTLIGVALFLIWISDSKKKKTWAYGAFALQLALNTLWSIMFFGLHLPWLGVVTIGCLLAAIIWTMVQFRKHSRVAFWLLVPYLLWVTFATYLNTGVALLN